MKNELIKLAKALKLSGYNSYSYRILKIADEFDEMTVETNYDKVYAQINSFIQDLSGVEELDAFAKAPLTTVGLQHIVGSLDKSSVSLEANIEKIENHDDVPEIISIDYIVKLRPMIVSKPLYRDVAAKLKADGSKDKIIDSFNEAIEESYNKHRMTTKMPEEVEVYDRRSKEEIELDQAGNRVKHIRKKYPGFGLDNEHLEVKEDPLDAGLPEGPLRSSKIYLGESQQTIDARFNYTTSVKFKQRLEMQAGSNPRAEDDSVAFISIHYNVSIKDPKKDTTRRNDLNKKHQEKMKEDKRKAEIAEAIREEHSVHLSFIEYLSDIQNTCQSIQSPASTAISRDPRVKACEVIVGRLNQFKDFYGITKLDEPIKEEVAKSISRSKGSAAIPSTGLLFENSFGSPNFEESIEMIGKSRPMNIPYRLK